jgi:hypothetical protein
MEIRPVKLIIGLITGFVEDIPVVEDILQGIFGRIDLRSDLFNFDFTQYYKSSMGQGLKRKFLSFQKLLLPEKLVDIKLLTNSVEKDLSLSGRFPVKRPFNLDPGYISFGKLVLASTKDYSHRIYVKKGIYQEVTLKYVKGSFRPFEWTYSDYRTDHYINFFNRVRKVYQNQLRSEGEKSLTKNR